MVTESTTGHPPSGFSMSQLLPPNPFLVHACACMCVRRGDGDEMHYGMHCMNIMALLMVRYMSISCVYQWTKKVRHISHTKMPCAQS